MTVYFFGFIVGNMLFVIQIGAFFKVVVLEKVMHWCWSQEYSSKNLDRVVLSHHALIGYAIRDIDGIRGFGRRFAAWYIHNFFPVLYSIFYYWILFKFIWHLLGEALVIGRVPSMMPQIQIVNTEPLIYALTLISVNIMLTLMSAWLLRDLRPLSHDWSTLVREPAKANGDRE